MGSPARLPLHPQSRGFPVSQALTWQFKVRRGGNPSGAPSPGCHPSLSQIGWTLVSAACNIKRLVAAQGWLHFQATRKPLLLTRCSSLLFRAELCRASPHPCQTR